MGISHYNRPIIKIVGFSTCLSVRAFLALNMGFFSSKNGPYYNYGSLISKGGSWVFNVGLSSKSGLIIIIVGLSPQKVTFIIIMGLSYPSFECVPLIKKWPLIIMLVYLLNERVMNFKCGSLLPMSGLSFECGSLIKKWTLYCNCGPLLPIQGKILLRYSAVGQSFLFKVIFTKPRHGSVRV